MKSKTAEEILDEKFLRVEAADWYIPVLTAMEEYASQFQHPVPDEAGEVYSRKQLEDAHIVGYTKGRLAEQDSDSIYQDAVNYAATISPVPPSGEDAGNGWISVEDRLPENNVPVLVTLNNTDIDIAWKLDVQGYRWCKYHGGELFKGIYKVTHWQPLPPKP